VAEAEERGNGEIEMALIDQARHLPVEEGDQERGDMGAVNIGRPVMMMMRE